MTTSPFPALLQRFFTDRLVGQLGASPHTIAAYRDTFRLVLRFAKATLKRAPSSLRIEDLDVTFLSKFLDHLESTRHNTTRTRNNRLAAVHAFFRDVAISEPGLGLQCQRVLAMPAKRYDRHPGVQGAGAMATRVRVQTDERVDPLGGDQRSRVAWMTRLTTRPATTLVGATARPLLSGEAV